MKATNKVTRADVVDYCIKSRLIEQCCECQLAKKKEDIALLADLQQDVWIWLLQYDEKKLLDAFTRGHLNALITATITNWVFSTSSPYWTRYHRQSGREDEITYKELNIPE